MEWVYLLVPITFVPTTGVYGPALDSARTAAFIQSGVTGNFERVRTAAEKKVPVVIKHGALVYNVVSKQELSWRGRTLDGTVGKRGATLLLHVEW